jgi:hypothetical protein
VRRYALNIGFNLLNKSIFKYFPYPYTVSTVHVVVGLAYCILMYVLGFKAASFGRVSYVRASCGMLTSLARQYTAWLSSVVLTRP